MVNASKRTLSPCCHHSSVRNNLETAPTLTRAVAFYRMKPEEIPANWFEDFFHGVTLDLWRKAIPPEQTQREAEFLIKTIACPRGAHLLDVPCGNGRLSFALAKRGFAVTGIDISEEFVEEANS